MLYHSRNTRSSLWKLLFPIVFYLATVGASVSAQDVSRQESIAQNVELRILPLGDSITFGEGSTDGNGYRLALSNLLTNSGRKHNYIGTVKSGTMTNNENEGHGGFQIVPVGLTGKPDYLKRPNVVLFMAGTNDIVFDVDVDNAPRRLGAVAEGIVQECPDAAVLVGSLTPLANPGWMSKIERFNAAVPDVIAQIQGKGKQVALVNMSRITLNHIHTDDGIHPTDEAYALIAAAWYEAIVEAGSKGWIRAPLPEDSQSQPSETSSPKVGDFQDFRESMSGEATLPRFGLSAILLLGLVVTARKVIGIFLRRGRG